MRILVIMKRFGANKDMLMQSFGRQIRLFEPLAKKHEIDFICPDYKKHERRNIRKNNINYYVRPYSLLMHFSFARELEALIKKNRYSVIVGSTDPIFCILGYFYAKKFGVKHIYDMQDDYTGYGSYKIPFIPYLDGIAVKKSDAVITVSQTLNDKIRKIRKKPAVTIQNGINTSEFGRISGAKAKKVLKLPKGKLIIYVGEISRLKGVDILIEAFKDVKKTFPEAKLLLSGKILDNINVNQEGVIYEEYPKRPEVVTALNAADVAVLPNRKSAFSKYCFPYKLLEYMAASLPIVAASIGDASLILRRYKGNLFRPDDKNDMAEKLIYALKRSKKINYGKLLKSMAWESLAKKLDKIIMQNG